MTAYSEHTDLYIAEKAVVQFVKEKLTQSEQEVLRLQKRLLELYEGLEKYITSK